MFKRVREQLKTGTEAWEIIEGGGLRYQNFLCKKTKSRDSKVKRFIAT